MKHFVYLYLLLSILLFSCKESEKSKITRLVNEWNGKEIIFPENMIYTCYGTDTVTHSSGNEYTVLFYTDSVGCTSCKMQPYRWASLIQEIDSAFHEKVTFQYIFHPKDKKELSFLLKRDKFDYPVCFDLTDEFNKKNKLPENRAFHTFLLNNENKVVAIGDPAQNPKIKELYINIISGRTDTKTTGEPSTEIVLSDDVVDLGDFNWNDEKTIEFSVINSGKNLLNIKDITTSCGCISLEYDRKPVSPGSTLKVYVKYTSEKPEFINKKMFIHGNFKDSPVSLTVKGNSKELATL